MAKNKIDKWKCDRHWMTETIDGVDYCVRYIPGLGRKKGDWVRGTCDQCVHNPDAAGGGRSP